MLRARAVCLQGESARQAHGGQGEAAAEVTQPVSADQQAVNSLAADIVEPDDTAVVGHGLTMIALSRIDHSRKVHHLARTVDGTVGKQVDLTG